MCEDPRGDHHRELWGLKPGLLIILIAAGILLTGCPNPTNLVLTGHESSGIETNPDSVRITTERLSTPLFQELGYIYVQEASLDAATRQARVRSARIGGTVIMNARAGVNITQTGTFLVFPVYDRSYFLRGIVVKQKGPR